MDSGRNLQAFMMLTDLRELTFPPERHNMYNN